MVNIADDDIWNAEPTLRPEDEILLRKLHDMLQSTADDLKLLSGELSKYHEPGIQVKSLPTPLDEDFNEKVHIEELVNAKFYGYNVVDKTQSILANAQKNKVDKLINSKDTILHRNKLLADTGIQVNQLPTLKKSIKKNNLTLTRTKIIEINENVNSKIIGDIENHGHVKAKINKPTMAYKELSFKYSEPNIKVMPSKPLQVQNMPSINIRSELKEQKVFHLNIDPKAIDNEQNDVSNGNIAVFTFQHEPIPKLSVPITNFNQDICPIVPTTTTCSKESTRKFSKLPSCDSSEVDSHSRVNLIVHNSHKTRPYRPTKTVIKLAPKQPSQNIKNKRIVNKTETTKHSSLNIDIWKKKLNAVYGCPTSSRKSKMVKSENKAKKFETKSHLPSCSQPKPTLNTLNNADYIPYSKLTVGGIRVSDIEKELSDTPNKNDITGSILNKILSRENSFHDVSPKVEVGEDSPKILTTSDENLLRELLEIERNVTQTLSKKITEHNNATFKNDETLNNIDDQDSYADDFEEEKSDHSVHNEERNQLNNNTHSDELKFAKLFNDDSVNRSSKSSEKENIQNKSCIKIKNLSLKENVDVFEFVPNIHRQDTGTQSNTSKKKSPKGTQTSPRNDKSNVQPIHNDLWPRIDPKGEVEKLFQLEKDFIKKLIVDEYGDLLEKNLNKPSTSTGNDEKNAIVSQKNTQTSPAHMKSVMTSPTRTKTRTTSPLALSLTVAQQTSPVTDEVKVNIDDRDDLDISINLSSPRFSLRLPQTSRRVMSHLESQAHSKQNETKYNPSATRLARKNAASSSSSADGDYSSSDISSLGEVRLKLKQLRKLRVVTLSDTSSSTSLSKYGSDISDAIIPLRSEGEVSCSLANKRRPNKIIKSEGEASTGC